ncbi:unnamed protein product [Paramecium sonneborni]|uniref:NAD(P)(+)--arginine ADP-ribosyltransferase n=1 Tax=Paramecium sonneborni TaxID=65129 RepID=A0A8S1LYH6_9CILI|nr:unnamed protein product [Paramecium sonneborni]
MKAIWYWNDSINPFDTKKESWTEYKNLQNEMIEHAYQQNKSQINLGEYTIYFKDLIQYNNQNNYKQRPIKRVLIFKAQNSDRDDRFSFHTNKPQTFGVLSFDSYGEFVTVLRKEEFESFEKLEFNSQLIEKAGQVILQLGNILSIERNDKKYQVEATYLANLLFQKQNSSKEQIAKTTINIYTKESFLYKEINRALREADKSRACVSIFAKLMNYSLKHFIDKINYQPYSGLLYRGVNLTDDQKKEYLLTFKGKHPLQIKHGNISSCYFIWQGYTSASKDRAFVDKNDYNTLFIINVQQPNHNLVEIEDLSEYPDEKEVLSLPGIRYKIADIKKNKKNNKLIIYLDQMEQYQHFYPIDQKQLLNY